MICLIKRCVKFRDGQLVGVGKGSFFEESTNEVIADLMSVSFLQQ